MPTLQLPSCLDEKLYKSKWPVSQEVFDQRASLLLTNLSPSIKLVPGMGFGEFRGTVGHREGRDFLWVMDFRIVVKEPVYERLKQSGLDLPCGPALMEDLKTYEIREEYRQILLTPPTKCMAVQSLEFAEFRSCPECGVNLTERPKRLFLRTRAVPTDLHVFAVEETDQLVADETFYRAVQDLKLNNIAFEPVELL